MQINVIIFVDKRNFCSQNICNYTENVGNKCIFFIKLNLLPINTNFFTPVPASVACGLTIAGTGGEENPTDIEAYSIVYEGIRQPHSLNILAF